MYLCLAPGVIVGGEQSLKQAHSPAASHLSETGKNFFTAASTFLALFHKVRAGTDVKYPAPTAIPCGFCARNTGVACEQRGHAQWREGPPQLSRQK